MAYCASREFIREHNNMFEIPNLCPPLPFRSPWENLSIYTADPVCVILKNDSITYVRLPFYFRGSPSMMCSYAIFVVSSLLLAILWSSSRSFLSTLLYSLLTGIHWSPFSSALGHFVSGLLVCHPICQSIANHASFCLHSKNCREYAVELRGSRM